MYNLPSFLHLESSTHGEPEDNLKTHQSVLIKHLQEKTMLTWINLKHNRDWICKMPQDLVSYRTVINKGIR